MIGNEEKFESSSQKTMIWLHARGFNSMNYPRWDSIRYCAKQMLSTWRYYHSGAFYDPPDKQRALIVIAFQPFSGLRGEWVEKHMGTWAKPLEKTHDQGTL